MKPELEPTVCLVDDDPAILKALARLLQSEGFRVVAFSDAQFCLNHVAAKAGLVPVLVSDIWMRGLNGMQLLAQLCAVSPRTRVIFITGHEDPAAQTTVMQAGAFAFLIKPFEDEHFLGLVRRALAESSVTPETDRVVSPDARTCDHQM